MILKKRSHNKIKMNINELYLHIVGGGFTTTVVSTTSRLTVATVTVLSVKKKYE